MSSRALNDDEVQNEMNKMVTFIRQEANEKSREIRVKADEEFTIEKAKLVKHEQQAIDLNYEKKIKASQVAQKIAQSTLTNKSRLKLLHLREEHLQDLFASARNSISTLTQNDNHYSKFLEETIVQGLLQLLESNVIVHCRRQDNDIVEKAAETAARTYEDISGRKVDIKVEGSLSDKGSGGLKLVNGTSRITLDNTLDERLKLLEERMLPEIRNKLFGPNGNRKFYN